MIGIRYEISQLLLNCSLARGRFFEFKFEWWRRELAALESGTVEANPFPKIMKSSIPKIAKEERIIFISQALGKNLKITFFKYAVHSNVRFRSDFVKYNIAEIYFRELYIIKKHGSVNQNFIQGKNVGNITPSINLLFEATNRFPRFPTRPLFERHLALFELIELSPDRIEIRIPELQTSEPLLFICYASRKAIVSELCQYFRTHHVFRSSVHERLSYGFQIRVRLVIGIVLKPFQCEDIHRLNTKTLFWVRNDLRQCSDTRHLIMELSLFSEQFSPIQHQGGIIGRVFRAVLSFLGFNLTLLECSAPDHGAKGYDCEHKGTKGRHCARSLDHFTRIDSINAMPSKNPVCCDYSADAEKYNCNSSQRGPFWVASVIVLAHSALLKNLTHSPFCNLGESSSQKVVRVGLKQRCIAFGMCAGVAR